MAALLFMTWWHWLAIGLILIALEMAASGGFYVIFFGVAAIAIGGLHLFDLAGPLWLQFLLFSVFSVGSLLIFRNPILRMLGLHGPAVDVDPLIGDIATPNADIAPHEVGQAELRGTVWSARNNTGATLKRGQRCKVVKVERLMLFLEPEGART